MKLRVLVPAVGMMVVAFSTGAWAQQDGAVLRWEVVPVLTGFGPAPDGRLSAIFVGPATGEVVGLSTAYIPLDALRFSDDGTTLHFTEIELVTTANGGFTNVMTGVVDIASLQFFESGSITDASGAFTGFIGNVSHNNATLSDLSFVPGVMTAHGHLFITPATQAGGASSATLTSSASRLLTNDRVAMASTGRRAPKAAGSPATGTSWGRIKVMYR